MTDVDERWLRRIDAHMERGNELFARFIAADERNTEAFERNVEAFERNTRAFERWSAEQDKMREFMREITLRVELAGREHTRAIRRMSDEITSELQAGRGALLAILDRRPPPAASS